MGRNVIRMIKGREELEEAFDLWAEVFPENRAFFQRRIDLDPYYKEETTWVAIVDNELAAAVQIFPYYISLDGLLLKVGGIGNVATRPQYRGNGLAQSILRQQSQWMRTHGFDLSLLFTGINPFYQKLGWETISLKSLFLQKDALPRCSFMDDYTICPYAESYLSEIQALYRNFINDYVGPVVRSQAYWEGQIQWCNEEPDDFLLALKDGKVMAYIRKRLTDDGVIQIKECCYLPEEEKAVHVLLMRIYEENPEMKGFKASLPSKHALYQLLQKGNDLVESEETYSMWKILDFSRFVEKLRGLLTQRVIEAKSHGFDSSTLLLQCGRDAIVISAQDEWVDITNPTEPILYDDLIRRTPKEFLTDLLFGTELDHKCYSLLFPKKGYLFFGTDAF